MARRLARRALLCALALTLFVPLSVETAAAAGTPPVIAIGNPPAVVANVGIPGEKLRLKLDEPASFPKTYAAYGCVPTSVPPALVFFAFFHMIKKPNGDEAVSTGTAAPGVDDSNFPLDEDNPGAGFSGFSAAIPDFGLPLFQLPHDVLGNWSMDVVCVQAKPFGYKKMGTAYSVEPRPYKDYVLEDNPRAYWRLGEAKGAGTADDYVNANDGTYKNGPALQRDGAPNCNVESRATTGCNDEFIDGVTSPAVSDPDKAAFFHHGQYTAMQDMAAPSGAYSVEAWVNPYDLHDMMIFQHGYGPALFLKDGKFVFRQTDVDLTQAAGDEAGPGEWFHVVGTWDGEDTAKLYVNSTLAAVSNSATTKPSGTGSTLYIGNGDRVTQPFHGTLDEMAYYDSELSASDIDMHHRIARYVQPSADGLVPLTPTNFYTDVTRPKVTLNVPSDGAVFNVNKVPPLDYDYSDASGLLEDASGYDIVVCVPGSYPTSVGSHSVTVTCTDRGGNIKSVTHDYTVADFAAVVNNDDPVGYWRLNDAFNSELMEGDGSSPDGTFKNADPIQGPVGISGDSNRTRHFFGGGAYGYVNGIAHPKTEYSMEAWIDPDGAGDMMIMQHGRGGALYIKNDKVVFRQTDTEVTSAKTVSGLGAGFHQVLATWDGVYARLYIDGELDSADVYAPTPPSGVSAFLLGYGEYGSWFKGDMDEASYYPTALTPYRVYEHFYADPPPGADLSAPSPSDLTGLINATPSAAGPAEIATAAPPAPAPADADPPRGPAGKVTIAAGKASVRKSGKKMYATLPLRAACPAGIEGKCTVSSNLSGRSGAGIAALMGNSRKKLAAGKAWTAKVKLTGQAAKALRKGRKVRVLALVAVQTPDGQTAANTAKLTLRRPAGK